MAGVFIMLGLYIISILWYFRVVRKDSSEAADPTTLSFISFPPSGGDAMVRLLRGRD